MLHFCRKLSLFQIMHDYKLTVGSERVKAMALRMKRLLLAIDSMRGLSEDVRYNLYLHYTSALAFCVMFVLATENVRLQVCCITSSG